MSKATPISELQKFHFGSKIFCSDGEEGILAHVIFDPGTCCMTHIGVKQGRFFGKTVELPFDAVVSATGEGVTLSVKRADVVAAPTTRANGALLDSKTIVDRAQAPGKGTLKLVGVHPENGELAYLVAHHLRPGHDALLGEEFVSTLENEHVTISIPDETLNSLPPYRPDNVLQQEVEAIVYDLTPLHIDLGGITMRVLDGVLYLDGNISSALRADIVQDQVSGVEGLLEIKNNLVGDDKLAADLAMALGNDPRTRELPIGVYPRLGVVRLSGAVHNNQQKAAAEEIARNFPGVRAVINDLVVDPKAALLHVMSPAEGGQAEDKVPGKYVRHTK
jgi:osmotically-inducible protein OsmY